MKHYKSYRALVDHHASNSLVAKSIDQTIQKIIPEHIERFDFRSHRSGLLLGNVQSGKTGHMLGILAAAADYDFEVFIVLTTDSISLQKQTLERALGLLDTFCVCDEQDDIRFFSNDMRKPVVIILKKNARVLETWKNNLISSSFLIGRPVFIVDDESDAASLNTKVNKDEQSTINKRISEIRKIANSSFYLQVTATAQSLFLQEEGEFKPEFVYYFPPGEGYLGGNFFYSIPQSYAIRITHEDEISDLREQESHLPDGMIKAITSFLVAAAHLISIDKKSSCNFLIHPSVSISDHEIIAERIGQALNLFLYSAYEDNSFKLLLHEAWIDLQSTKPDILSFDQTYEVISEFLENEKIKITTMNSTSKSTGETDFKIGVNIVVGGNCLGRGYTFPNLQTTYYCRKSKKPQADTFWQHCRAFGYDRDPGLVRMFLPASLLKLFTDLNNANNAIIEYIIENGIEGIQLIYPKNVIPTRLNVVNKKKLQVIAGGVNLFPSYPTPNNRQLIDDITMAFDEQVEYAFVEIEVIKQLLSYTESEIEDDWPAENFINCIDSLEKKEQKQAVLIIRRNRNIGKETGTLLSPDDRKLGLQFPDRIVLTMYRITGDVKKGWAGISLWIPNIKFPQGKFFYSTDSENL
ncbi:Z1 domain-containing protein [Legionella pneumophila serogroup 1]|uniref:Z1 domain-containing protein n=1 Tax=Legionella pneumophila TaxID=446 RepID=UPI0007707D34|nr:Z1 domain-containing protein [Legionella pneumophila]CZI16486.1 Z1 domain [Legionella pneumophila]HAT2000661.1 restriction endonuclease [Legionella pneumophila]HAT2001472.1 restriction endonuclease [Legionella pneumophila]HAU0260667.1 restriction endonuclease [Legionella pneumophila]HAU0985583.1 restriction endonuclease [Legionella pneumophila]